MKERNYDSTIARMAGNIASTVIQSGAFAALPENEIPPALAVVCVKLARAIVAEVQRTEPEGKS